MAWQAHQSAIIAFAHDTGARADAAHDMAHLSRVVTLAERLARDEGASLDIVMPAAWLHDCVHVPVTSADRPRASVMAGRREAVQRTDYMRAYLAQLRREI